MAVKPLCPLDGQQMHAWLRVPFDADRGVVNPFAYVYRCQCGHGTVYPVPTVADIAKFYQTNQYYTHGAAASPLSQSLLDWLRIAIAYRVEWAPSRADWITKSIPAGARTICDIGCGSGGEALALKAAGYEVVGVEPDPAAVSRLSSVFEVHDGTAEMLPDAVRSKRFDAVLMTQVLEHCADPIVALKSVRSILKSNGALLCEVPNNDALGLKFAGPTWAMLDVPRHLHFFTGRSLRAHCERAGFRVENLTYAFFTRQVSNDFIARQKRWHDAIPGSPRSSKAKAWLLLALSALAPAHFKYDSVRVEARVA